MTTKSTNSVGRGGARKGAGRPRKPDRVVINYYVNEATRDAIDALAESLAIRKGEVVERAVEKFASDSGRIDGRELN